MSLLKCCLSLTTTTTNTFPPTPQSTPLSHFKLKKKHSSHTLSFSPSKFTCHLSLSFQDIAAITQNKVLIAAGVSAAIGQLSKPFTSVLLYGNSFDVKAVIQAGGFPSTHSSAVVATATSLALERGFSDSVFGMAVVYAGLVMYDAQGVRREVGIHARTINRFILEDQMKSLVDEDSLGSLQKDSSSTNRGTSVVSDEVNAVMDKGTAAPLLLGSRLQQKKAPFVRSSSASDIGEESKISNRFLPLKESIGHTEVEVIAGALLGFLVSLTVYAIV